MAAMASEGEQPVDLQFSIGCALKTTARNVLFKVYKQKFGITHPGRHPFDIMMSSRQGKFLLNQRQNKATKEIIQDNNEKKFDITALWLLLKYACGLSRNENAWKDETRLEGNIDKLRQLRNDDAHWTEEGSLGVDLEDKWRQLVQAVTNVLQMAGLEKDLPKFRQELESIKAPPESMTVHLICNTGKKNTSVFQMASLNKDLPKFKELESIKTPPERPIQDELRTVYRSGRKTTLMPILWAGKNYSFHHHVSKSYTRTTMTVNHKGIIQELDGDTLLGNFLEPNSLGSRIIILQGESGTGKTSLLRHYAASWTVKDINRNIASTCSVLCRFHFLVFLDCTAFSSNTVLLSDILQEIMPQSHAHYGYKAIEREIVKAGDDVMFLVDAFDERRSAFSDGFKKLQSLCSKAYFIITTRPHCTQSIAQLCQDKPVIVTAQGFNWSSAEEYVTKLFRAQGSDKDPQDFLKFLSKYNELTTVPQLLCWSSWFWLDDEEIQPVTRGKFFAAITDFMLRKMCYIHGDRIMADEVPRRGRDWLSKVSKLAFKHAQQEDIVSYNTSSPEIQQLHKEAEQLKLRPQEALSSLMQCDSSMKARGECIVFQFLHSSHANFLVAHHICETLQTDRRYTLKRLFRYITEDRQKPIMSFLVPLLFRKDVSPQTVTEIVEISSRHVKFYDINHYLDLIKESNYNSLLARRMSSNLANCMNETQCNGYLWLRPKELQQSLELLLSYAKPQRLWLRLCEGPRDDESSPVRGHQVKRGDPVAAMELISRAYKNNILQELRLTDCTIADDLSWPKALRRLSLERCTLSHELKLPTGILKISLNECSNIWNVQYPASIRGIAFKEMDVEYAEIPNTAETVSLESCDIKDVIILPPKVKHLRLCQCKKADLIHLPEVLDGLTVHNMNLPDDMPQFLKRLIIQYLPLNLHPMICQHITEQRMGQIRCALDNISTLRFFVLSGIALLPEDFVDFFFYFQDKHPKSAMVVESLCELKDDTEESNTIRAVIMTTCLPNVTVRFREKKICKADDLDDDDFLKQFHEM